MADVTDADREAARTWANNRVCDGLLPSSPVAAAAHGYEFGLAAGRAEGEAKERARIAASLEQQAAAWSDRVAKNISSVLRSVARGLREGA